MKKIRPIYIMRRAGAILLATIILLSAFAWMLPTYAQEHAHLLSDDDHVISYYPRYESPEYVAGKVFISTSGITAPVKAATKSGEYYEPTAYVYFGSVYDSQSSRYVPLVHRVLDPDNDNTGGEGAMFLLSEFATYQTQFAYNGAQNNAVFTTDNIYPYSVLGNEITIANYAGKHYGSKYSEYFSNIPKPLDYIRPVTKHDSTAEMEGLFLMTEDYGSFGWEVDAFESGAYSVEADSVEYLKNATFFPLSAKELNDYVATYSGAPGMAVKYLNGDECVTYWLRTGLDYFNLDNETGDFVGGIDQNGNIAVLDADDKYSVRYGFNLELEDIAFTQILENNTHRISFIEPLYKDTETPFEAEIVDVKDGVVTVVYKNAIRDKANVNYANVTSRNYLSVIIKDKDTQDVKHYGSVYSIGTDKDCDPTFISDKEGTAKFTLPEEYEEGDGIYVFWERKNEYIREEHSFVSNMVKLDCVHVPEKEADCKTLAKCKKCGEEYGSVNPDNHIGANDTEFSYSRSEGIHWKDCSACGKRYEQEQCHIIDTCTLACKCGNVGMSNDVHRFDGDGICIDSHSPNKHYKIPDVKLNQNQMYATVEINSIGEWLGFATLYNDGVYTYRGNAYTIYIRIKADLNFVGEEFIPLGNEKYPFKGAIYGEKHNVKNIQYSSNENGVGFIGVASDLEIKDLYFSNCTFEGADSVGVVLGKNTDNAKETRYQNIDILDCMVSAINNNGKEGIIVGAPKKTTVYGVYTHNVTNYEGENLTFSSDDSLLEITQSVYLASESGEHARTKEQYASGHVAYEMGLRQYLGGEYGGADERPTREKTDNNKVGKISYCDGALKEYTNHQISVHLPMDQTVHRPSKFYEFVWNGSFCTAKVYCDACNKDVEVNVEVEEDYSHVPVRGDYTARIVIGENTYEETITLIGIHIEEMIGMTKIEKEYDGIEIFPEDLMNNHRLDDGSRIPAYKEYEVFFLDDNGNKISEVYTDSMMGMWVEVERALPVSDVGTYDLLVIGQNNYEGQQYIYKDAVVINKTVVTITPKDVYKYYDGSASMNVEYEIDKEGYDDTYDPYFELIYSDAKSADVGDYELNVTIKPLKKGLDKNITFNLISNTVMGYIFPTFYTEIENKNYPLEFTYGDVIPAPTAENFAVSEGSALTFEWFAAEVEEHYFEDEIVREIISKSRIYSTPKDAGFYVLRVRASHTKNTVEGSCEYLIEIKPRELSFELVMPDGVSAEAERIDEIYNVYYFNMGDEPTVNVKGFINGDTLESIGGEVSIYVRSEDWWSGLPDSMDIEVFPYQSNTKKYMVTYELRLPDGNYFFNEENRVTIGAGIKSPLTPSLSKVGYEYIENGEKKEVDIVLGWNAPQMDDPSAYRYSVSIKKGDELVRTYDDSYSSFDAKGGSFVTYRFDTAGDYVAEIVTKKGDEIIDTQTIEFTISILKGENAVDSFVDIGRYTVKVTSGEYEDTINLVVKRELVMKLKEFEYFLNEKKVKFDKTMVVMEAGKVLLLDHELIDADIYVDTSYGTARVDSITAQDKDGNDVSDLYVVKYYSASHGEGIGTAHIFDAVCDSTCNVYYCEYTRGGAHSGGTATCTSLAICEHCNAEYGSKDIYSHTSDKTHIVPNPDDLMTHKSVHSCCGLTAEIMGHTPKTVATCTSRAVCADCGWHYGVLDPKNHASDKFNYTASESEAGKHIKVRACCGEEALEEHSGGEATCSKLAKCQFCSAEYGALAPENHDGTITYANKDTSLHTATCSACQVTWEESHKGGEATCTSLAICEKCEKGYGEYDSSNHTSEEFKYELRKENPSMHDKLHACCDGFIEKAYHSGGEANCLSAAICETCNSAYGDKDSSKHASEEVTYALSKFDTESHVKYHTCCGVEIATEKHTLESEATCESGNFCSVCKAEYGEPLEHVYDNDCDSECNLCNKQTRALKFHVDEDNDGKCDNCEAEVEKTSVEAPADTTEAALSGAAISGIVTASTVTAGAGGFSIAWFAVKKKSFAALLKLLFG